MDDFRRIQETQRINRIKASNDCLTCEVVITKELEEKELKYKDYKYTITAYYTKDHKLLGEYKTANRANEILLDIYKQIMIQNFSFTYKMPKE